MKVKIELGVLNYVDDLEVGKNIHLQLIFEIGLRKDLRFSGGSF